MIVFPLYFLLLITLSEVSFFLTIKALASRKRVVLTRRPDVYKSYILTIGGRLSLAKSSALTVTSRPSLALKLSSRRLSLSRTPSVPL